jgi:sialate O-acetylesterase
VPLYKNYVVKGNNVIISFTDIGLGLATSDTDPLKGFSIAGKDKKFYWASARIEGNKVIVSSDKIDALVAVRYAWSDKPVCNLVNSEGLPAIPFRTDDWKGITQK